LPFKQLVDGSNPSGRTMSISFKEHCIALRREGKSIIEVMKITGRAKSSVHGHIKDIPLSAVRRKEIGKASGDRIRTFALARKGKSVRRFTRFARWTPDSVALLAHLLFDGGIYPNRGCAYSNRSAALLQQVEERMRSIYEFKPARHQDAVTGVWRISYYNVALGGYLKAKSTLLLKNVSRLPLDSKREFVRAFFDDEGCVDYRPEEKRRSVRGYQKDTSVLRLIRSLLKDFHISARIVEPNEVVVVGKENLQKFEREISFSPGVFMNGNRSNSRWKKNMEKRVLLRQAIASFKN
jgi:intein/homing endonuclease